MSSKNKRIGVFIIVAFLILGLVVVYIPLIFTRPPQAPSNSQGASLVPLDLDSDEVGQSIDQLADSLVEELVEEPVIEEQPLVEESEPDGFSGLEDELNSLDELDALDNLLEGF